jgi:type IX secretion system PorP/SprF family membrane protein
MNRRLLFSILLLTLTGPVRAQKEVFYYQYLQNPMTINPALAGSRESLHLTAQFRRKWIFYQNQPTSQSLAIDGAVANRRVGLALLALNDQYGAYANTGFYGAVAYHFNLPALAKLSVGVQGGASILPIFDGGLGGIVNKAVSTFGVGVFYRSDRWYGGLSLPEIERNTQLLPGQQTLTGYRPVFLLAGYKLNPTANLLLIPSVLVTRADDRPLGLDLNAKLWYAERLALGLSFRHNPVANRTNLNYVQLSAECQLASSIRLGYVFNSRTPEALNDVLFPAAHELMFRFTPNLPGFQPL